MGIMRLLRYFARGVLAAPLVVIVLGLIFTYLPGLANFISNIFWGLLGETKLFSLASNIIAGSMSHQHFTWEDFWGGFLQLMLNALSEAVIMAVCVFVIKSSCIFFNRKWEGRFSRPEWLLTLIGVIIGVVACGIKNQLSLAGQGIYTLIVTIALYVVGIVLMLRGSKLLKGHPTYRNRRDGFIIKMLLGIVGNMLDAFCGVFFITALMEGPRLMDAGGSFITWVAWIGLSAAVLHLKNMLMDLMQPQKV